MNRFTSAGVALVTGCWLLLAGAAQAQVAGTYQPLIGVGGTGQGKTGGGYGPGGGLIRVLANSTNVIGIGLAITNTMSLRSGATFGQPGFNATNLVQDVSQFDYVGFTWSYALGTNVSLQIYQSNDGGTIYGANPAFSFTGTALTNAPFATNALLDVHGATHLAFVLNNGGATDETNVLLELHLKASKVRILMPGEE